MASHRRDRLSLRTAPRRPRRGSTAVGWATFAALVAVVLLLRQLVLRPTGARSMGEATSTNLPTAGSTETGSPSGAPPRGAPTRPAVSNAALPETVGMTGDSTRPAAGSRGLSAAGGRGLFGDNTGTDAFTIDRSLLARPFEVAYGRVVGVFGDPVADVEVQLGRHTTTTNARGIFHVPRASGILHLRHPKYFPQEIPPPRVRILEATERPTAKLETLGDTPEYPTIVLVLARREHGWVRDADGVPIEGARVVFVQDGHRVESRSDAGGAFKSPALRFAPARLQVSHPQFQTHSESLATPAAPAPRAPEPHRTMTLQRGVPLELSVTSPMGPLAGAELRWFRDAAASRAATESTSSSAAASERHTAGELLGQSDALGTWRGHRPPGSGSFLHILAAGFKPRAIPLADRQELTTRLQPAAALNGLALNAHSGLPVSVDRAVLERLAPHGAVPVESSSRFAGMALGRFVVEQPTTAGRYRLTLQAQSGELVGRTLFNVGVTDSMVGPPDALRVAMQPRATLRGVVLDQNGGSKNAQVSLEAVTASALEPGASRRAVVGTATTDASGRFDVPLPGRGVYVLRAEAAGFVPATTVPIRIVANSEPREFVLRVERGSRLLGRIVKSDGSPASHFRVRLQGLDVSRDVEMRTVWTQPDGRYAFDDIPGGMEYRLRVDTGLGPAESAESSARQVDVPRERTIYYNVQLTEKT